MTASHAAWYQTLDSDKKRAIRELHKINPYWNLVGLLFVVLWIAAGAIMVWFPSPWIRIPDYVLIGLLIHGMANLMHEAIHGTLFKNRRWERRFGFVMAVPSLFSITAYRVNHLLHHRHNRQVEDPDEFSNVTKNRVLLRVFYYAWLVFGMFLYAIHVPCVALTKGTRIERRKIVMEYLTIGILIGLVTITAWRTNRLDLVLHLWLIPLLVAAFLGNVRGWAEHTQTRPGHPLTETRTVRSNPVFSFFNINLNYHLEHHLFPGVPWYHLPKVHRILLDDYKKAGASIYGSYTRFLIDAFRSGLSTGP